MPLQGVKVGDIVECDVRGRKFFALVEAKIERGLKVKPITPNINHFQVKSTEVITHYRKKK